MPSVESNEINFTSLLNKNISEFCDTGFTDDNINHCAHFVSHILDLSFGATCRAMTGRPGKAANIRVNEIFSHCPEVGEFKDANQDSTFIVFVTAKTNVDLQEHSMCNVPQKHVGIYHKGYIYHYANTKEMVVRQKPASFEDYFNEVYNGKVGLYFGTIPLEHLIKTFRTDESHDIQIIPKGDEYYATIDSGEDFYIGKGTRYKGNYGLYQPPNSLSGPIFESDQYLDKYDHWTYLMDTIGYCGKQKPLQLH